MIPIYIYLGMQRVTVCVNVDSVAPLSRIIRYCFDWINFVEYLDAMMHFIAYRIEYKIGNL